MITFPVLCALNSKSLTLNTGIWKKQGILQQALEIVGCTCLMIDNVDLLMFLESIGLKAIYVDGPSDLLHTACTADCVFLCTKASSFNFLNANGLYIWYCLVLAGDNEISTTEAIRNIHSFKISDYSSIM